MPQYPSSSRTDAPRLSPAEGDYLRKQMRNILVHGGSEADAANFVQTHVGMPLGQRIGAVTGSIEETGGTVPTKDNLVSGLSLNALQGLTFGFGDEAVGSLLGVLTGEGAAGGRDAYRQRLDEWNSANPKKALTAEILGGVATGVGGAAKLGIGATRAATTGGRIGTAAAEGAATGAAFGLGNAEGRLTDRTTAMVAGGLMGGIGGGAVAGGMALGSSIIKPLGRNMAEAIPDLNVEALPPPARRVVEGFRNLKDRLPGFGSSREHADNVLLDALEADGIDISQARAKAAALMADGINPTLADVGEDGTLALLREATSSVSPEKNMLRKAYIQRQSEQGARLSGGMLQRVIRTGNLGLQNAYDAVDTLIEQRAAASAPLYEEAYQGLVPMTDRMKAILGSPEFRAAYEQGKAAAQRDELAGVGLGLAIPDLPAAGLQEAARRNYIEAGVAQEFIERFPEQFPDLAKDAWPDAIPVRALDYMKQGLNEVQGRLARSGAALDSKGKASLTRLLNEVLDAADEAVPTYGQARMAFAGPTEAIGAVESGRMLLRKSPGEIAQELRDLSPTAQDFYRLGAAQTLYEQSLAKGEGANVAEALFGGRLYNTKSAAAERIRALFPGAPDVAENFMRQASAEARISRSASNVARPRANFIQESEGAAEMLPPNVRMTPTLTLLGAMQQGVARVTRAFKTDVSEEMAKTFYAGMDDPRSLSRLFDRLEMRQIRRAEERAAAANRRRGVSAVVGMLAGKIAGSASN